jgi:hypothetical protein
VMSITAVRRGFRFLAAASVALISTTGSPVPVPAAPAGGALYAVFGSVASRLALVSGAQTAIADLRSLNPARGFDSLVADQGSPRLFGLVSYCICGKGGGDPVQQIATIGERSSLELSPVVSPWMLESGVVLDPSTHSLLAINYCFQCQSSIVRIDPHTGTETSVALIPGLVYGYPALLALAPATHTLYVTFAIGAPAGQLFSVDTAAGTTSSGPHLTQPVTSFAYDSLSSALFGITSSTRQQLVRIDPITGAESVLHTFSSEVVVTSLAIDPTTHTAFVAQTHTNNGISEVFSINDQSGSTTVSQPMIGPLNSLAFQAGAPDGVRK